jgi:hypothetical protein
MYTALNWAWNSQDANIFSTSELTEGSKVVEDLVIALNLSRPSIKLLDSPTEYDVTFSNEDENKKPVLVTDTDAIESDLSSSACKDGTLVFEFQINNPTDPDPANTRYTCNLYIDQNGDGRHHKVKEHIAGLTVEQETAPEVWTRVDPNSLQAKGATYRVSRTLGEKFTGSVAWKLEVVKVTDDSVHASEKGFAYIEPQGPTKLNVLQVRTSDPNTPNLASAVDGEEDWEDDKKPGDNGWTTWWNGLSEFQKLYWQVYHAGMYDIEVDTITIGELNDMGDTAYSGKLKNYEMVILGFDDLYSLLGRFNVRHVRHLLI